MGLLRVGHDWATSLSLFTIMHWRRKWQPTPVFPGMGKPGGLLSMGSHSVGHDWSDLAAAAAASRRYDMNELFFNLGKMRALFKKKNRWNYGKERYIFRYNFANYFKWWKRKREISYREIFGVISMVCIYDSMITINTFTNYWQI